MKTKINSNYKKNIIQNEHKSIDQRLCLNEAGGRFWFYKRTQWNISDKETSIK